MLTILRFGESMHLSPEIMELRKTIPPNSTEMVNIPVSSIKTSNVKIIKPIPLFIWYQYTYEDGREIKVDHRLSLAPVMKNKIKPAENKITIDGDLKDWSGLPHKGGAKSTIGNSKSEYHGDFDAHFDFNISYDEDRVLVGMAVWDDDVRSDQRKSVYEQDAVLINIDARPLMTSANDRTNNNYNNNYFHLYTSPSMNRNQEPIIKQAESLPEGTKLVIKKTIEGFNLELSIPLEYIKSLGGDDWETLRLNITYYDQDDNNIRSPIWWKPNWSSADNYIGSGIFFKSDME